MTSAQPGFFGIRTLSVGIYTTWLAGGKSRRGGTDLSGDADLCLRLSMGRAQAARHQQSFAPSTRKNWPILPRSLLKGWRGPARDTLPCALPVAFGFVVPVYDFAALCSPCALADSAHVLPMAERRRIRWCFHGLAASIAVCASAWCSPIRHVQTRSPVVRLMLHASPAAMGYAVPGTVMGLGILISFAAILTILIDGVMRGLPWRYSTGFCCYRARSSPLIFTATLARPGHFDGLARKRTTVGSRRMSRQAARTLGRRPAQGCFSDVHLPMLRPAIVLGRSSGVCRLHEGTARDAHFASLRFRDPGDPAFFTLASLDQLEESALPALTIVATGLIPVILLSRTLRDPRRVRASGKGGEIPKQLEGFGIGQRFLVLHLAAMDDIAYGQLSDLSRFGSWNVLHCKDHGGYMAGRGPIAHLLFDLGDQLVIQSDARRQSHKKNDAHVIIPVLADGQGFKHFGDRVRPGHRSQRCRCARRRD